MYSRETIFDPSFGIRPKALAIANMLNYREPLYAPYQKFRDGEVYKVDVKFYSSPLYNGRERGICITMSIGFSDKDAISFWFDENRNSDGIFVQEINPNLLNPPTLEDTTEEHYSSRKWFDPDGIVDASDYIFEQFKKHLDAYVGANPNVSYERKDLEDVNT